MRFSRSAFSRLRASASSVGVGPEGMHTDMHQCNVTSRLVAEQVNLEIAYQ